LALLFAFWGVGVGSLYFMVLSVCVFAGEEIIRFEVAKKKFVSFNGEKRKKLATVCLFLCLGLPGRKLYVEGEEERNWRCCILMKKRLKFCFGVL